MTEVLPRPRSRVDGAGLVFLLTTSVVWGLNWPVMKFALSEWPPLSSRGWTGVVGAVVLGLYALFRGESLRAPADQWPRLLVSSVLNVTLWMFVMSLALLWLPASEAVVIAYTMPVWTALLVWPLLGERLTALRIVALVMAFAGLASLFGGDGISASATKIPGMSLAFIGAVGFAFGTIFLKRFPIKLPGATSAALQIGVGSLPVALVGSFIEHPDVTVLTSAGWAALSYMTFAGFCIAYVSWFAALERLPASIAAIGTMLAPVIGVAVSAIALHEPLGAAKIAALAFTVCGVALASRS